MGESLKRAVQARACATFGVKTTVVAKNIGYELALRGPRSGGMEYTRDLGYCAAKYLIEGATPPWCRCRAGTSSPSPSPSCATAVTGKARIRLVDVRSTRYAIARRYMIRVRRDDFEDRRSWPSSPPPPGSRLTSSAASSVPHRGRAAPAGHPRRLHELAE